MFAGSPIRQTAPAGNSVRLPGGGTPVTDTVKLDDRSLDPVPAFGQLILTESAHFDIRKVDHTSTVVADEMRMRCGFTIESARAA